MAKRKYFAKSYKEKTNPYPSGEGKGRTMWVISHPLPPINENSEFEYSEYNGKEEISSVFWESAYDAEQEIYANLDKNYFVPKAKEKKLAPNSKHKWKIAYFDQYGNAIISCYNGKIKWILYRWKQMWLNIGEEKDLIFKRLNKRKKRFVFELTKDNVIKLDKKQENDNLEKVA